MGHNLMKMRPRAAQSSLPSVAAVPSQPKSNAEMNRRDVADYIADMTLELSRMAQSAGLTTVMVPLEFAYYEAFSAAHKVEVHAEELNYIRHLEDACCSFLQKLEDTESGNSD